MDFLPKNYDVPSSGDKYMKFKAGENRFRILSSPVVGFEWWEDSEKGRKPVRVHMSDPVPASHADDYKHFWAMPVWNYQVSKVQILEITQKSIQRAIKAISADDDWGSPVGYDLVVNKTGDGLETEYQVTPKPAKVLDAEATKAWASITVNLNALYDGEDPFANESMSIASDAAAALN